MSAGYMQVPCTQEKMTWYRRYRLGFKRVGLGGLRETEKGGGSFLAQIERIMRFEGCEFNPLEERLFTKKGKFFINCFILI